MRTLKEEVAYCQSKGFFRNTIELSTMLAWLGEQTVTADRLAALEAKVRELEAELQRRAKQIGVACMKHDLTHSLACWRCYAESRQQVERLVGALTDLRSVVRHFWNDDHPAIFTLDAACEKADEALAAVEKERHNAKVSGAGTASAGLPGYTAGDNTE